AIGIIWVPLTIASFATLENRFWPEAMAVFHLMRNIGSSFFISMCVADIVRVTAQNYSRMTEMISPFNDRLAMPWVMGGWNTETLPGLARLAKEINRQAAMIGYLDAFALYTAASAAAVVLVMLVSGRRGRAAWPVLVSTLSTSVTCGPRCPGATRTSSVSPGLTEVAPMRPSTVACRKASPVPSASSTKPKPFSDLNHLTVAWTGGPEGCS